MLRGHRSAVLSSCLLLGGFRRKSCSKEDPSSSPLGTTLAAERCTHPPARRHSLSGSAQPLRAASPHSTQALTTGHPLSGEHPHGVHCEVGARGTAQFIPPPRAPEGGDALPGKGRVPRGDQSSLTGTPRCLTCCQTQSPAGR